MNMKNMLLVVCLLSISLAIMPIVTAINNTTNETFTPTATPTTVTPTPTVTVSQTPTITATITPVVTTPGKFRVGPTVKIRPLNDIINKTSDGLVEIYMDNPSLNDVTLNVDARISVPSGIHVYGQGFGEAGAAGTVYGTFNVPPGSARTIYVNIKAEKTGDFYAQFSGLYWPGDDKDAYQPISLTHPFKVEETSPNPQSSEPTSADQLPSNNGGILGQWWWLILIIIVAILAIVALGRKS